MDDDGGPFVSADVEEAMHQVSSQSLKLLELHK
jgi:hypothetical protein